MEGRGGKAEVRVGKCGGFSALCMGGVARWIVESASIFWVSIHPIEKHLIKHSFIVWEFKKIIIERAMVLISNSKVFEIYKGYTKDIHLISRMRMRTRERISIFKLAFLHSPPWRIGESYLDIQTRFSDHCDRSREQVIPRTSYRRFQEMIYKRISKYSFYTILIIIIIIIYEYTLV